MSISVAIVDDQSLVRMGLRALIESEPGLEFIGEAENGREGIQLVRQFQPDVVLMDIRMPHLDGLAALKEITSNPELSQVKVVMLTTFELDEYVFASLESGASGFLLKDSNPDDIVRAILAAAAGESLLSPSVTRTVISTFTTGHTARTPHPRLTDLTERETEVLTLVGQGLDNTEIAAKLWISKATARTHVSRIIGKLGARDRAQLVVIAYTSGLV